MKLKITKGDDVQEGKKFDLQDFMNTLNTLDPQNVGAWPLAVKVLVYIVVFVSVLVLGYVFDISSMRETYVYKKQLADMETSFGSLLKQLPKDTEVPELLEDVTHTGLGSGLEFDGINLGTEVSKEFYAELPITIKVHGDYHAFGAFVSGVSALPRIVTLHDLKILPLQNKFADNGAPVLTMEITAKTYRYNDSPVENKKTDAKSDANQSKGGA